ncbi:ADP-glyceromanno-heptose 6-epimerase [Pseudomonadota bacterium]|nr:ADP-glyceromanno-heptose 6-epimerase [Pseudomonadota bacterium]
MKDTILVTGGAGFIGSNLISNLNRIGYTNIILSDYFVNGKQVSNVNHLKINDFVPPDNLCEFIKNNHVDKVFHLGACSDTTEWNGEYMMEKNFSFSKRLLNACTLKKVPFIYASSASVYGLIEQSNENPANEKPLNIYGFSKLLFDNFVRSQLSAFDSLVCGVRYFNVFGPNESHKKGMASVIYHFNNQLLSNGVIKIFRGSHNFDDGGHLRDFIEVGDAIDLTIWLSNRGYHDSGIYNCGTGVARSFNDVAQLIINWHKKGKIEYIDFPSVLLSYYQPFTCADLSKINSLGYKNSFKTLEEGVNHYMKWLNVI